MIMYFSKRYNLTFNYSELEKYFLDYSEYCEKNNIIPLLTTKEFYQIQPEDKETFNEDNINNFIYFSNLN